jgi:ATP-dependent Clp protease ATP-binding subunit ClpA
MRLDKLTVKTREALVAAQALAQQRGQPELTAEHVLAALLAQSDGLVPGLYLVVQPSGAKSWAVRYRSAGRARKLTLGSFPAIDLAKARESARSALVAVADGADPARDRKAARQRKAEPDRDVIDRVVDVFLERHARPNTRPSSAKETARLLATNVLPKWRGRRLAEITRADVHDLLDAIGQVTAAQTLPAPLTTAPPLTNATAP